MELSYGLLYLFIIVNIIFYLYSRRKKSKTGITVSIILILWAILRLSANSIEEISFSKIDVLENLRIVEVELKDDFEILNNKITGVSKRTKVTEIIVTQTDKIRLINEIENSKNFQSLKINQELASDGIIYNFKYPEYYSREYLAVFDENPTLIILSIYNNSNKIKFQRIEF